VPYGLENWICLNEKGELKAASVQDPFSFQQEVSDGFLKVCISFDSFSYRRSR
jgi:hypothetical protein